LLNEPLTCPRRPGRSRRAAHPRRPRVALPGARQQRRGTLRRRARALAPRAQANLENQIKEAKLGLGLDNLPCNGFHANWAATRCRDRSPPRASAARLPQPAACERAPTALQPEGVPARPCASSCPLPRGARVPRSGSARASSHGCAKRLKKSPTRPGWNRKRSGWRHPKAVSLPRTELSTHDGSQLSRRNRDGTPRTAYQLPALDSPSSRSPIA
jgi:hypothetical protein